MHSPASDVPALHRMNHPIRAVAASVTTRCCKTTSGDEMSAGLCPAPFVRFPLSSQERDRSGQLRRDSVSDQLYLLIQGWLIIALTVLDGGAVLIQHPGWFQ